MFWPSRTVIEHPWPTFIPVLYQHISAKSNEDTLVADLHVVTIASFFCSVYGNSTALVVMHFLKENDYETEYSLGVYDAEYW